MKLRPEEILQQGVVHLLNLAFPRLIWFHVPNQKGTRSGFEMRLLKSMGVKAGVADLIFCLPGGRFGAIELKPDRKARVSDAQLAFRSSVVAAGAAHAICYTPEEVYATLKLWGC